VTRIKFLNGMGQRVSQTSGRPPTSQGRVRSANAPGTCVGNTTLAECLEPRTSTARQSTPFSRLSARAALLGQRGLAICCVVSRSDSVKLTGDFASHFSGAASQLLERAGVSVMVAHPTARATVGLTFDNRSMSPGCDSETNTESQGDLSCRRNKRTRLPRSVRLPYENRSGDRSW
jgi:hypothetical protein